MKKLTNKALIIGGFNANKSMMFASAIGIGLLNQGLCNIFNAISEGILKSKNISTNDIFSYNLSSPFVRLANGINKSTASVF